MFQANRAHRRYPIFARGKFAIPHEIDPVVIIAQVKNISEAGLGAYTAEPVRSGSEISMNIEFFNTEGKKEKDTLEGKIVWSSKHDNMYNMGISFNEELNPARQPDLHRHFHMVIKHD